MLARARGKRKVDVLLVRGETTLGLRRGDDAFARGILRAGASLAQVKPRHRLAAVVKRHLTSNQTIVDLCECLELRLVTIAALAGLEPRCIVYCTWSSAALQPRSRLGERTAIRFDSPASLGRRGRLSAIQHALERRAFRHAGMLLPWGVRPRQLMLDALAPYERVVPLPVPVHDAAGPAPPDERRPLVVAYAGNPHKKGLDIVVDAWERADPAGMRLVITGIAEQAGREWLAQQGLEVPDRVDWAGRMEEGAFRELLRGAEIFLAASRYEDHGIAQLQALDSGALLVTVPSEGPFEPISVAEALEPALVAEEIRGEALAAALTAAVGLSAEARRSYRARAAERLREYSEDELVDRLRLRVFPQLLGWTAAGAPPVARP
jgi:glycosyltransferase involved in cell wall biosynthesis